MMMFILPCSPTSSSVPESGMTVMARIDEELEELIATHGFGDVLAALCRFAHQHDYYRTFVALSRVYENYSKGKEHP